MTAEDFKGIVLTPARVGFMVSLITLATAAYVMIGEWHNAQSRVAILEKRVDAADSSRRELANEIKRLSATITDLTIELRTQRRDAAL